MHCEDKTEMRGAVEQVRRRTHSRSRGFTTPELLIVCVVGTIVTAIGVPVFNSAMANMRLSNMVSNLSGAVSSTRYQAIMRNKVYTLAVAVPGNTYTVTDFTDSVTGSAIPLATAPNLKINSGTTATYTFTLCPNGTVYGTGGGCPNANAIPALSVTYGSRQVNIAVSSVGNVTTTIVQ